MERKVIKANKGMILTDGEIYGTTIYLAVDADETKFIEIPIEEYNLLMESEYTDEINGGII